MNNVFIKPRMIDGTPAIVRDPVTKDPLAAGGQWKPKNQFWVRRINDGDVIDETAAQQEKAAAAKAKSPQVAAPVDAAPDSSKLKS